jgi:hypothetical protein
MSLRSMIASCLLATASLLSSRCVDNALCAESGGFDDHVCSKLVSEDDCSSAAGCSWGPACGPILCRTITDAAACAAVSHCLANADGCLMRLPTITECESKNQRCEPSDRCAVATQCTGAAKPCDDHKSAASCSANRLCEWIDPPDL